MTYYPTDDDKPNTWQVQEAKARFGEFLETTIADGPQIVTKRGIEAAVLIPIDQWRKIEESSKRSLKDLLLAPEARTDELVPTRSRFFRLEPPPLD